VIVGARGARIGEYPALFELFQAAFEEDEAQLFDFLVANDPTLTPDTIRVVTLNDRPVACSIALPRKIRTAFGTWVPGAIITLVACHPDHQGRGFGSLAVLQSLEYAARRGARLAILYGHPSYYPRFGFVPVLPAVITTLDIKSLFSESFEIELQPPEFPKDVIPKTPNWLVAREVRDEDAPVLLKMHNSNLANCPCYVGRDESPWIWKPRGAMSGRNVLVFCKNRPDNVIGYAFIMDDPKEDRLGLFEAATLDSTAAPPIILELAKKARNLGRRFITTSMHPDTLVVQTALSMGATQKYKPAGAGMACVLRWTGLLPEGYEVIPDTVVQPSPSDTFEVTYKGKHVLRAKRDALTRLVLGYEDIDSLASKGELEFTLDGKDAKCHHLELLRKDFPKSLPKWYLAPYWY